MRKRILTILMAAVVTLTFVPILEGNVVYAFEDTGNATFNSFINDSRYTEGVSWSNCYTYVQAFTSYCFGNSNPKAGAQFSNTSEVRAGDVIWINGTHYFAVLKRSGNSLYVAEGNYNGRVKIRWGYTISGNLINNETWTGWHWGSATPPEPPHGSEMTSGYSRVLPDGDYKIANAADPLFFLDIAGAATPAVAGTNVQLWHTDSISIPDCDAWTIKYSNGFYRISQYGQNMSLDVSDNGTACGKNVHVWNSNNASAQKWAISPVWRDGNMIGYRMEAKCSGYSLDIEGGTLARETNVRQWTDNDSDAQAWVFIPYKPEHVLEDGKYILVSSLDPNVELDVSGDTNNVADGTNVQVWHDNIESFASKSLTQYNSFNVKYIGDGYYTLIHAGSGKALDSDGCTRISGKNIHLWSKNNSLAQQWAITKQRDGFQLRVRRSGFSMDVEDGKTNNGTNVRQLSWNGSTAQTWKFVPAEYTVKYNANGGSGSPASQIKYYKGDLLLSKTEPSRSGYSFVGWNTNPNGSGKSYSSGDKYTTDSNLTLYAQWAKNSEERSSDNPSKPASSAPVTSASGASEGVSAAAVTKYLTTRQDDSDAPGSTYGKLTARAKKTGKKSQTIVWNSVNGAVKYNIYANKCGKNNKLLFLGSVTGTSFTHKGLKKGTYYKYMVVAVDKNERVAASSKVVHSATAGGKVGNFKKVRTVAKKNKVNLKTGKKFKLKAKGVKGKGKVKKHRAICYESSNPTVATVSKKGIIKGVAPGQCIVYAYAQNGVFAKVKVTVK